MTELRPSSSPVEIIWLLVLSPCRLQESASKLVKPEDRKKSEGPHDLVQLVMLIMEHGLTGNIES